MNDMSMKARIRELATLAACAAHAVRSLEIEAMYGEPIARAEAETLDTLGQALCVVGEDLQRVAGQAAAGDDE